MKDKFTYNPGSYSEATNTHGFLILQGMGTAKVECFLGLY